MRRALLLGLLLAVACMREKPDVSQSTTANPQSGTSQDTALNPTVPINQDSPTSRVPTAEHARNEIQLLEYEIRMPETLAAGVERFDIANAGKERHGFAIEGMDVKANDLAPGMTSRVDINFEPGTYTVYCPVKGHREKGMQRQLTVQ